MSEFASVSTVADHRTLDESEVLIGYMDGIEGIPPSPDLHSRSYFHGWRNGMVESGLAEPDSDWHALAAAFRELVPPTIH
jgi:hypothetical protein